MPRAGDSYVVEVKRAHLEWGSHRYTLTRPGLIYGEGYIKIPADVAYNFDIFNQTSGKNARYRCVAINGEFDGVLLAQGNQDDPDYAKQFSQSGDLKAIGNWYYSVNAQVGGHVEVVFTSSSSMTIRYF